MPRFAWLLALGILLGLCSPVWAAPPSEKVFPDTTQGYFSITEMQALSDAWDKTQLGQLLAEPMMEPFNEEVQRFLRQHWLEAHQRLGISWEDLREVPRGELAIGLAAPPKARPALIVFMDVKGNQAGSDELIAKASTTLTADGAKRRQIERAGTQITIFTTPVPKGSLPGTRPTEAVYFVKDETLVAGDSLAVLTEMLDRWEGEHADGLSSLKPYRAVMDKMASAAGELQPHIRWFVDPLGFASAQRVLHPRPADQERDLIKILRNQGFAAIQGIGGYVHLAQDQFDAVHRTLIYAPPPHELAMRMFSFPNDENLAYPEWVPADISLAVTLRWEMQQAFDSFGTLFDEFIGDKGAFADVLDSIKTDPDGPQVDIRNELIAYLGTQATLLTDHVLPIAPKCQRTLMAVETSDAAKMALAVERVLNGDPSVKAHMIGDVKVWEIQEERSPEDAVTTVSLEGIPELGGDDTVDVQGAVDENPIEEDPIKEDAAEEDSAEMDAVEPEPDAGGLPSSAICVAHGHLMIASHLDYLKKILEGVGQAPTLRADPEVQQSAEYLKELGVTSSNLRLFVRSEKALRPHYELLRTGQATDANAPLGKLIKALGGDPAQRPKEPFDGSKMPEFEKLAGRLGTHGVAMTTVDDGWLIVGFKLPSPTQNAEPTNE